MRYFYKHITILLLAVCFLPSALSAKEKNFRPGIIFNYDGPAKLGKKLKRPLERYISTQKLYRLKKNTARISEKINKTNARYSKCIRNKKCIKEFIKKEQIYFMLHLSLFEEVDGFTINAELIDLSKRKVLGRSLELAGPSFRKLNRKIGKSLKKIFETEKEKREKEIQKLKIIPRDNPKPKELILDFSSQNLANNKAQLEHKKLLNRAPVAKASAERIELSSEWWFWAGIAVAAGGVGLLVMNLSDKPDQPVGASVIINVDLSGY